MILTDNQSYEKLKSIKFKIRHCHEDLMALDENLLEIGFICDNMLDFIYTIVKEQLKNERNKDV